jgi:hypothetical protein
MLSKSHLLSSQKQHHSELQLVKSTKAKEVVRLQRQVQAAEKKGTKMLEKEKRRLEAHVHAINREAKYELKHKEDVIKVSISFCV